MSLAKIIAAIAGAFGLIFGAFGGRLIGKAQGKAQGRKEAETDAKQADTDNARAIRDRVERDLPKRVRDFEDRGFRDGK